MALTRASLGRVAFTREVLVFAALARRARPAAALGFAALAFFAARGFATLARVALAFVALARAVLARVARVALAFAALALTFVARAFALALVVLSLAAARVAFFAFVRAADFFALDALARFAAARVAFFAFVAADFFLAPVRVARAGARVALRRAGAADLRVVARFVVAFRRFAAFTAAVRRAAGREDAAFRLGFRAAERAAGFAFRVRAAGAARLELAALALVALFRSFFEVFRVFFAAMGVLSHDRSGCPLPCCGELTYIQKGPNAGPQPSNLLIYPSTSPVQKWAGTDMRELDRPRSSSAALPGSARGGRGPGSARGGRGPGSARRGRRRGSPRDRARALRGAALGAQLSTLIPSRFRMAKYSSLTA
ncbi:hypothetical protein [Sorangium sp. So ce341]|uniref:hypothetical protein n=1 Tax=Sorangium sp. So ce341 TaxID=3133302 RepID=UPI003F5DDE3F